MTALLRQHFDSDLSSLQLEVLRMGTYVMEMLDLAVEALLQQDVELAARVIDMDDLADSMDLQIEQSCLRLLALQQPMARDLRTISSAMKIITDLERIGDFSVDIAKTARRMSSENFLRPMVPIAGMAAAVKALIRETLQAYVDHDLDRVHRAIQMDDEVDAYYDRIFTELMRHVERDASLYRQAIWLSHVLHFLERMADHAVNVAERVSYMVTGEFTDFAHHRQVRSVHRPSAA